MHTGDLARRDADGCYFIVGRLKRFLKIFGLRIGLDEVENLIRGKYGTDCYCSGDDEYLLVKLTNASVANEIPAFNRREDAFVLSRVKVEIVDKILRNELVKLLINKNFNYDKYRKVE